MNEFQRDGYHVLMGEIEGKLRALEIVDKDIIDQQNQSEYYKGKSEGLGIGIRLLNELLGQAKGIKQDLEERGEW